MCHLRRHIDRVRPALQRIQEIGKTLPFPGQAVGEHNTWDFLDALQQVHQRSAMVQLHRGKTHAAIRCRATGDVL